MIKITHNKYAWKIIYRGMRNSEYKIEIWNAGWPGERIVIDSLQDDGNRYFLDSSGRHYMVQKRW